MKVYPVLSVNTPEKWLQALRWLHDHGDEPDGALPEALTALVMGVEMSLGRSYLARDLYAPEPGPEDVEEGPEEGPE